MTYKESTRGLSGVRQLAAAEARRVNAEMATLAPPKGPLCRACKSELRIVEVRGLASQPTRGVRTLYTPAQTISFCPVHGLGFQI